MEFYVPLEWSQLTAVTWVIFNIFLFGMTICCACCDRHMIFADFCNVLKISGLSIERALNFCYIFLISQIQSPCLVVAIIVAFIIFMMFFMDARHARCYNDRFLILFGLMAICSVVIFVSLIFIGRIKKRENAAPNCQIVFLESNIFIFKISSTRLWRIWLFHSSVIFLCFMQSYVFVFLIINKKAEF